MTKRQGVWNFLLPLAVAAAAAVRIWFAATKSFSHPEMSVPLIPLPFALADPGMRATLYETFVYNLMSDTHPPGFYLFEWFWMKLFGDSALAIRMPVALLGAATVWLLWLLARRCGWRGAALPAAALLAFHGYHAAWSGFARMYGPACFLAVLSLWLLVRILQNGNRPLLWAYGATLIAGVFVHVFFWAIAGAQILFVLARGEARSRVFTVQALALTLASPLLALAGYQSFNRVATLGKVSLVYFAETVSFGMLLPLARFTDLFDPQLLGPAEPAIPLWRWLWWAACAAVLCVGGLAMLRGHEDATNDRSPSKPIPIWLAAGAALIALAFIETFIGHVARPNAEAIRLVRQMRAVPFLLAALACLAARLPLWSKPPRWASLAAAPLFVPIVAMTMLAGVSCLRPILTVRGLLPVVPFVLLALAIGTEALLRRHRWFFAWAAVVTVACGMSLHAFSTRLVDPQDFLAFSRALTPRLSPNDLILLRRNWDTTPVLFYLRPKRYRVFASDYCAAVSAEPEARVWALRFYRRPNPAELTECVGSLVVADRVVVGLAEAVLYQRKSGGTPDAPTSSVP